MTTSTHARFVKLVKDFFQMVSWRSLTSIVLYLFGALFFYGSRLLAPLHVPIALILVFLALKRIYRLYRARRVQRGLLVIKKLTVRQLVLHKVLALASVVIVLSLYTFFALVPTDKNVFSDRTTEEIAQMVSDDTRKAAQLVDMLTVTGEALLNEIARYKKDLTIDEQESLRKHWNDFLGVAILSEEITDTHRYFPQISPFTDRALHTQSFTISYALYMLKFAYFHRIIGAVGTNNDVRTLLNEYASAFGAPGSYTDVSDRFFATNSLVRRTVGYLYYKLMTPPPDDIVQPEYHVLLSVAGASQDYLLENALSHLTHRSVAYSHALNDRLTDAWLPIQKTVFVDTIGNVHIGDREQKFITAENIAEMKPSLQPGDIFVARKNWYASNVGIPGFWTHAGLYTGTLDDMRAYFGELFPYEHNSVTYDSFDSLLSALAPAALVAYQAHDTYGNVPSVIESETTGTNIQSIEYTARVDYFGVMRPRLPKSAIMISLVRAFQHYQKPYDYEFSLTTKDEIFCSELVFDAYIPMREKAGIDLPISKMSGRALVAPNDIVKKYVAERGTPDEELTFVYFLDGNERTGVAVPKGEEDFATSYLRPKFSVLQE